MSPAKNTEKEQAGSQKTPAPEKRNKKETVQLPYLLQLTLSFSKFFLVLVTLAVILIAHYSQVTFEEILVRTIITIITVGGLLLTISWVVANGTVQAAKQELGEAVKASEEPAPTAGLKTGQEIEA